MQTDFDSVEAELKEIDADFASGRMNAFGTAHQHEGFIRELHHIADLEAQVFYKNCAILQSCNDKGHSLTKDMFHSAQEPPAVPRPTLTTAASSSSGHLEGSFRIGESMRFSFPFPGGNGQGTRHEDPSPMEGTRSELGGGGAGGGGGGTHTNALSDDVFDDISTHFQNLEREFGALGDNLRLISRHVKQLNDMTEGASSSVGFNTSFPANFAANAGASVGPDFMTTA